VFTYTAAGSGYFTVLVGDMVVSKHTTEREALENANRTKVAYPTSEVRVKHDYEVAVEFEQSVPSSGITVGVPVEVTVTASDPAAVSVEGSLKVTPLADVDVVLSLAFGK
jgi:Holliday junction resolvase RusA-like endonuclease